MSTLVIERRWPISTWWWDGNASYKTLRWKDHTEIWKWDGRRWRRRKRLPIYAGSAYLATVTREVAVVG